MVPEWVWTVLALPGKAGRWLKQVYKRLHLKYAVPFFILLIYTMAGAIIFQRLELAADETHRSDVEARYKSTIKQIKDLFVEFAIDPYFATDTRARVHLRMQLVEAQICQMNPVICACVNETKAESPWNFWNAMLYAGTLYTTIGYGRPAAATPLGQIVTCIYTMIGIPLFLIILRESGAQMSRALRRIYKRVYEYWDRHKFQWPTQFSWRRLRSPSRPTDLELGEASPGPGGAKSDKGSLELVTIKQRTPFPISLAISLLLLWTFMSAKLISSWEDWGLGTSMYFFFVSISTVGLGDFIPSNSKFMLLNFLLILIGLVLLSMCINMIQMYIEALLDDMLQQFMMEFEKISAGVTAQGSKRAFELGLPTSLSPLATAPLQSIGERKSTKDSARDWLSAHFANLVTSQKRTKRSDYATDSSSSSESSEEVSDVDDLETGGKTTKRKKKKKGKTSATSGQRRKSVRNTMSVLEQRTGGGGMRNRLLAKMMNQQRLGVIEERIIQATTSVDTGVQTENEFSELIEFLSLPRGGDTSVGGAASSNRAASVTTLLSLLDAAAVGNAANSTGPHAPLSAAVSYATARTGSSEDSTDNDYVSLNTYHTAYDYFPIGGGDREDDRRWSVIGREAESVTRALRKLSRLSRHSSQNSDARQQNSDARQQNSDARQAATSPVSFDTSSPTRRSYGRSAVPRSVSNNASIDEEEDGYDSSLIQSVSLSHRSDCEPLLMTDSMMTASLHSSTQGAPQSPTGMTTSLHSSSQGVPQSPTATSTTAAFVESLPPEAASAALASATEETEVIAQKASAASFTGRPGLFAAGATPKLITTRSSPDDGLEERLVTGDRTLVNGSAVDGDYRLSPTALGDDRTNAMLHPQRARSCGPDPVAGNEPNRKKRVRFQKVQSMDPSLVRLHRLSGTLDRLSSHLDNNGALAEEVASTEQRLSRSLASLSPLSSRQSLESSVRRSASFSSFTYPASELASRSTCSRSDKKRPKRRPDLPPRKNTQMPSPPVSNGLRDDTPSPTTTSGVSAKAKPELRPGFSKSLSCEPPSTDGVSSSSPIFRTQRRSPSSYSMSAADAEGDDPIWQFQRMLSQTHSSLT